MKRIGMWTVLGNAFRVLFKNIGIALFIAALYGGVGALLIDFAIGAALSWWKATNPQQQLIVMQLTMLAVGTTWGCIAGSWAAPAGLYLWVQEEKKLPTKLYDAINYGLNRFPRVLRAHGLAFLIVQLGLIVIVPGILFGLQYAFVDAIATLDTVEKKPLARSKKLTYGRRGTIFRTFAVFLVWWVPYQLAVTYELQGAGWYAVLAGGIIDALVLLTLDLCMVQYYLDLFRKSEPAPEQIPAT